MLNCILGMVDKTKRALGILQQRSVAPVTSSSLCANASTSYNITCTNAGGRLPGGNNEGIYTTQSSIMSSGGLGRMGGSNFTTAMDSLLSRGLSQQGISAANEGGVDPLIFGSKVPVSDMLAATLRSTEERVIEVRRRAEEAVLEVDIAYMGI